MRGQNKRGNSRRTQRDEKRAAKEDSQAITLPEPRKPAAKWMPPPDTLISDLALVQFAQPGIDREGKALLFKAFAYNFANQALSPLDRRSNGLSPMARFCTPFCVPATLSTTS
jgi:hypothetical protein